MTINQTLSQSRTRFLTSKSLPGSSQNWKLSKIWAKSCHVMFVKLSFEFQIWRSVTLSEIQWDSWPLLNDMEGCKSQKWFLTSRCSPRYLIDMIEHSKVGHNTGAKDEKLDILETVIFIITILLWRMFLITALLNKHKQCLLSIQTIQASVFFCMLSRLLYILLLHP